MRAWEKSGVNNLRVKSPEEGEKKLEAWLEGQRQKRKEAEKKWRWDKNAFPFLGGLQGAGDKSVVSQGSLGSCFS